MAKQTFTTGQVLTAAQMTSLQQTAMGGGEATAKTASYTLVAADAGTTVIMNSGSATTITVNTALFAAGDTVNIQNIGAGICTVTAGTATVNTAGSLALNQYEGGVLYFRSTSAATFFDYVQTGSVSPLTTKGDLYGFSTLDARIPIGTNGQILTADSTAALGLKWAAAASPSYTWTSYTPTWKQGGTTLTTSSDTSKYLQIGKVMFVLLGAVFNSAGAANAQFRCTAPSGLEPGTGYGSTFYTIGSCQLLDSSASTQTLGTMYCAGSEFNFASGSQKTSPAQYWGVTGSDWPQTIASGDQASAILTYLVN